MYRLLKGAKRIPANFSCDANSRKRGCDTREKRIWIRFEFTYSRLFPSSCYCNVQITVELRFRKTWKAFLSLRAFPLRIAPSRFIVTTTTSRHCLILFALHNDLKFARCTILMCSNYRRRFVRYIADYAFKFGGINAKWHILFHHLTVSTITYVFVFLHLFRISSSWVNK